MGTVGAIGLIGSRSDAVFASSNGHVLGRIWYCDLFDFPFWHRTSVSRTVRFHAREHPLGGVHADGMDVIVFPTLFYELQDWSAQTIVYRVDEPGFDEGRTRDHVTEPNQ